MSSSLRAPEPFSFGASDLVAQPVLDKFTAHFEPRRSEVFERFKFLRRHQLPGETFDSWLIDLRGLVKTCGYGTGVDSVLRDQIVLGVADPLVREKLLYEKDLLLTTACEIVLACELQTGSLNAKIFMVDVDAREVHLPVSIRMPFSSSVQDLKLSMKSTMNIAEDPDHIHLVTIRNSNELHRLTQKDRSLRSEGFQGAEKVYATVFASSDENEFLSLCKPRLYDLIDRLENLDKAKQLVKQKKLKSSSSYPTSTTGVDETKAKYLRLRAQYSK